MSKNFMDVMISERIIAIAAAVIADAIVDEELLSSLDVPVGDKAEPACV
jgi:hypothetical protein